MTLRLIHAQECAPQPWRNGGGQTRELLVWPPEADWQLRISRADIAADGPFSPFPGVQRWFAVLEGPGVALALPVPQTLRAGDAPLEFDGAAAPDCRLLDGPTQDLNLMTRQGRGYMQGVIEGQPWHSLLAMRGLYSTGAGTWSNGARQVQISAHTLLWDESPDTAPWTFTPDASTKSTHGAPAYWLGFTPHISDGATP
ncbi:HutD family protein [Rhodoferax sp. TBRC 17198]|uniref:HutD/Ves family protein n=1 Tax=Rhodoferax potami TaxID=3068338 RepID=UPI0028BE7271|nr:HutD family protein [Rhodoferax sp. TBRC 17198]MDT7521504.1 HutD family protein [Rhodoferax sp. TBRC 17198]